MTQPKFPPHTPCGARHPLAWAAAALFLAPCLVHAQSAPAEPVAVTLERVEITGSAIKRLSQEAALPVQVITREEISKAGLTTAAEILSKLSANVGGLTDGGSIHVGGYDQKGFNSANLRGLGTSSTLVLLNGRRLANFASPGDDAGVDLNNIPAAAIQRVEVLLDGASALYGTDAIGGVINFITRKDYRGVEVSAYGGRTSEGGAGKRTASVSAGHGDLARDGFNVFGVLDVQRTDGLRSSQRRFIRDLRIPERLPHLLSGFTSPANIDLTSDQLEYLQSVNFKVNGQPLTSRRINLSRPNCNPPANLNLPNGVGGPDGCTYDYMGDTELYPASDKIGLLSRAVWELAHGQQLYAEFSGTQAKTTYVGSATRLRLRDFPVAMIPALAATGLADVDDTVGVRARIFEAGGRSSTITSQGQRLLLGHSGQWAAWDVDMAYQYNRQSVDDANTRGYLLSDSLESGVRSGKINIFGPSNPAGRAYIDSIQVNDVVRRARGQMDAIDFKASRTLGALPGGDMAVALGLEARREAQQYRPSALLLSDNIHEDGAGGETGNTHYSRRVSAAWGEWIAPFAPGWELQLAARADRVQGVGSSFNPKLAMRYQPSRAWLLRGSASTGFRAPSLSELYRPTVSSATATLPDPVCMQEHADEADRLATCADNFSTLRYSNSRLKPEKSRQFSLGWAAEPNRHLSLSVDYWNIRKIDLISEIGDDIILGNLAKYGHLVHRYSDPAGAPGSEFMRVCGDGLDPDDNSICYIELRKENRGQQRSSGLDLVFDLHGLQTDWGRWGARLSGTVMLSSSQQTAPGDPFVSNLGRFVTEGAVQRWRHRLSLNWEHGPVALSLHHSYISGHEDQNAAIDTLAGTVVPFNRVKAYSLWDVSGSWAPQRDLTLRAGVQNLANTAPPFSNQAYFFISGYDPSYTDPRGRFVYASLQWRWR